MLSKEEAVLLPFVLLAWAAPGPAGADDSEPSRIDLRHAARRVWPLFAMLAVYLAVRTAAGGMTPATAPAAYQFTQDPLAIGRNVLEYLDRAATLSAAAVLVMALAGAALPRPTPQQKRLAALGVVWMIGHLGLALLLPIRSSLYAVGPSAGAALAGAALLASVWQRATPGGRRRMLGAAVAITILTVPVHWSRNERWVAPADLSAHVLDEIAPVAAALPANGVLLLEDDRGRPGEPRFQLRDAAGQRRTGAHRTRSARVDRAAGRRLGSGRARGARRGGCRRTLCAARRRVGPGVERAVTGAAELTRRHRAAGPPPCLWRVAGTDSLSVEFKGGRMAHVSITVNGKRRTADVEPRLLLVHFLREHLNLTGAHVGCDTSQCGACTVPARRAQREVVHHLRRTGRRLGGRDHRGAGGRRPAPPPAGRVLGRGTACNAATARPA